MSKILQQLCKSNIVRSHKGPSGGFVLIRDPATLTMLEVVEEIEGPIRVFECFSDVGDCPHMPSSCRILSMFDTVGTRVSAALKDVRLADFLAAGTGAGPVGTEGLSRQGENVAATSVSVDGPGLVASGHTA